MGFLDFIFGAKKRQVEMYLKNEAVILDVRTQREWDAGHIKNSIHIPLSELNNRVEEVKQLNKPIIACCASGVRSAKAAKFLNLNNIDAINGGGWISLQSKL
ncbi:rhodanese-like domain-containing protein [Winogradskyella echinorum]|uniref:Rhodanese-like domain-containing protein n=1 Tax=Winogradskyella echinorum TaxID=538189 RepID=A0ABR6Y436_9FLAO|nr:rhodanese-like domain-containing protein [Winogradskyella echinorum]MBC3847492.1 rhodanese-like domain-containing protein [Winogradskyella echinorum]MBC5751840.1 rhodanese-like domain-containing protein [Winogradskyella echinorum]